MKEIRLLHRNIFEIAKFFDKFCQEQNLKYWLLGGTALGAMRHEGFIPWDDDFDVCMLIEDYQELLKLKNSLFSYGYHLQAEDSTEWLLFFSKIRLDNSLYIEAEDEDRVMHNGIYIDVMCLSPGYNNVLLRYSQYLTAKLLSASALGSRGYRPKSFLRKVTMVLARIICTDWIKVRLLNYVRFCSPLFASGKFYNHFFGRAPFRKACIAREHFSEIKRAKFETYTFPVMTDLEKYLDTRFGKNWREMPSDSVRDSFPPHCIRFEPHPDFLEPL